MRTEGPTLPGTEIRRGVATALVVMTFALVLMGALSTSNEAGDSVPGWPLAWGTLVPVGHLTGNVIFEYFHRVVAGLVAAATLLLTVMVLAGDRRPATVGLAIAALCLVVVQALLGGVRVRLGETHSYGIATIHAFTAQLFLGTASALLGALSVRGGWGSAGQANRRLASFFLATAVLAALQALAGASFRHKVLGFLPHGIGAILVAAFVLMSYHGALMTARGTSAGSSSQRALAMSRLAVVTLVAQVLLGAASWLLLRKATGVTSTAAATVVVAVLHLGLGSALIFENVTAAFRAADA